MTLSAFLLYTFASMASRIPVYMGDFCLLALVVFVVVTQRWQIVRL